MNQRSDDIETVPHDLDALQSRLLRHWNAIRAEGITASEFMAFLQPLADLDGITVSYVDSDEEGDACVYDRRRNAPGSLAFSEEGRA